MSCLYIHVSKNAIVSEDMIFYLLWYNSIRWSIHTYKKSSFVSVHSSLFLVDNAGEVKEYNWHSATQMNGMKNAIMQVTYILNGSMISLLFYCHIIFYWEKVTSCDTYPWSPNWKMLAFHFCWWKYQTAEK